MPVEHRWFLDQHIVLNHYYGVVTMDDLANIDQINHSYFGNLQHDGLLHLIVDMHDVVQLPIDVRAARVIATPPPRTGWIVLMTDNTLHKMIASMISLVARLHYTTVTNLDEALDFLRQHDAALWPLIGKPTQDDEQDAQA